MKKLLLMIFFAISVSAFAVDGYLRVGAITETNSYNHESGSFENYAPTFSFEATQDFLLADLGAGIAYNGKTGGTDIGTVPVYLVARWNLLPVFFEPYIVLKAGRVLMTKESVRNSSPDGKGYIAGGFGIDFMPFQAELLYSETKIDGDRRGSDRLKQLSLIFGYRIF